MAFHVIYEDETGFPASDYAYPSEKDANEAYAAGVKRIDAGKQHDLHQSVTLVVDGKETKRHPAKAKKDLTQQSKGELTAKAGNE